MKLWVILDLFEVFTGQVVYSNIFSANPTFLQVHIFLLTLPSRTKFLPVSMSVSCVKYTKSFYLHQCKSHVLQYNNQVSM